MYIVRFNWNKVQILCIVYTIIDDTGLISTSVDYHLKLHSAITFYKVAITSATTPTIYKVVITSGTIPTDSMHFVKYKNILMCKKLKHSVIPDGSPKLLK